MLYFAGMLKKGEDKIRIAWKRGSEDKPAKLAEADFYVKNRSLSLTLEEAFFLNQIVAQGLRQLNAQLMAAEEAETPPPIVVPNGQKTAGGILLPFTKQRLQ